MTKLIKYSVVIMLAIGCLGGRDTAYATDSGNIEFQSIAPVINQAELISDPNIYEEALLTFFREIDNNYPFFQGDMVVLIDAGTISAGETFARDLGHYARAFLMGSKTAGASSSRREWALPHELGKLVLSVRSRWRSDGLPIEYNGIEPSEVVEAIPADLQRQVNTGIKRAEAYLDEKWRQRQTGEPGVVQETKPTEETNPVEEAEPTAEQQTTTESQTEQPETTEQQVSPTNQQTESSGWAAILPGDLRTWLIVGGAVILAILGMAVWSTRNVTIK